MRVRFWGTRGSVPTPGPATTRFGGNTSCVEVVAADGTCLVLDCGTGARELGLALLAEGPPPIHILLTHTHWDHIQGFPFFAPAYLPGTIVNVYATSGLERTLEEALSGQMQHTYFPVRLSELRAQIAVHEVGEGIFRVGGITIHHSISIIPRPAWAIAWKRGASASSTPRTTSRSGGKDRRQPPLIGCSIRAIAATSSGWLALTC